MFVTHLECTACGRQHAWSRLQNLCLSCSKPLFAIVDLAAAGRTLKRATVATREKSLWRYREGLPLPGGVDLVSLGEGGTPLLRAEEFGGDIDLWIKDESINPTQSFKARGMSVAVSMAKHLGATKLAVPSAGNAGGALAAYAARAGLEAHVFMPRDTPQSNIIECRGLGAHVTLIDGLITDCGAEIARHKAKEGWFDMSTLKEPYRVEGKKTLGYELAEQSDWELPNVICIRLAAGPGSSECGKHSMKWRRSAGSEENARACLRCKPPVVRQLFVRSKPEKKTPRNFRRRTRSPLVCVFPKQSAIS